MRQRLVLAALVPVVVALGGVGTAHAAPTVGDTPPNHGQCVKDSPQPTGKGGRSATAKSKDTCTPPLDCIKNEDDDDTVALNRRANTVTITGSGAGSAGSSLECKTSIPVEAGDEISFSYELGDGTDPCGGGVPRVFVVFADGSSENTIDSDPACAGQADDGRVTYTLQGTGTVVQAGFVYDRGDTGSVTYSEAKIAGVTLNI